ncbi:NAD(P)H-binding protein [Micromonospora sp. DR5-3]|uniref:NAD(P)-dependent oxidoreductase n=1 Tax=unclassified Micromonospora TaxID=2617518 RepID=UPI0011D4AA81|nr:MULTISPECIES: NAD(P)H-binding protein [unclassified Micromonospora]MCW3813724.1 NAD(P)H-binding protein [Micromonospora sp. DR5-3]TYC25587.1 NAD(P)H-binding protein [Micromonospora sp. MP36]
MRLTIFGASGGIGRHLVAQALAAGHDVTAVVRDPARLPDASARVVTADLSAADPGALRAAVAGADAVLSGLGPRSAADAGVASRGTRAVAEAMTGADVRRIVVVSAAPVGVVPTPGRPHPPRYDEGDGPLMRFVLGPAIRRVLRRHYADLALMEEELRDGVLDWTVVRPPRLTDGPLTGGYRTAYGRNIRGGLSVSRADVAHLMLALLDRPQSVRQTVGVAR